MRVLCPYEHLADTANPPVRGLIQIRQKSGFILNPEKTGGTEEQTTARGTEERSISLFLWLMSVPLYLSQFAGFGMMKLRGGG
jgi:hypothetical protein